MLDWWRIHIYFLCIFHIFLEFAIFTSWDFFGGVGYLLNRIFIIRIVHSIQFMLIAILHIIHYNNCLSFFLLLSSLPSLRFPPVAVTLECFVWALSVRTAQRVTSTLRLSLDTRSGQCSPAISVQSDPSTADTSPK